jgi:hypothetical protein
MNQKSPLKTNFYQGNAWICRGALAALSLLGATACGSDDAEERLASIELDDGNIVSFEKLGDGISITEVGLAGNGSHLSGRGQSPVQLFRELAPDREVPEALLAHQGRSNFWGDLPAGTLVFPSREAYEQFDRSTFDRSRLNPNGPTRMGEGPAPLRSSAPATPAAAASPQTGGFQQNAGVCGSFIQSQCNLQNAGMNGGPPDDVIVLPNINFRIDDAEVIRGHHSMCAADGNATLRVNLPDHPEQGTGGTRFIPEGSFTTVTWEHPLPCVGFGDPGPLGDGDDEQICFLEKVFVFVDARPEVFDVGSFHYCRAYDSVPN